MIRARVGVEVRGVIDLTMDICGIYLEGCQSWERGSEDRVKWFYVRQFDKAGRQRWQVHKEFILFLRPAITNLFLFFLFLVYV